MSIQRIHGMNLLLWPTYDDEGDYVKYEDHMDAIDKHLLRIATLEYDLAELQGWHNEGGD
jgi:hypothetical protein